MGVLRLHVSGRNLLGRVWELARPWAPGVSLENALTAQIPTVRKMSGAARRREDDCTQRRPRAKPDTGAHVRAGTQAGTGFEGKLNARKLRRRPFLCAVRSCPWFYCRLLVFFINMCSNFVLCFLALFMTLFLPCKII